MKPESEKEPREEAPSQGIFSKLCMTLVKALQVYICFSIVSGQGGVFAVEGELLPSYYYLIYASFGLNVIDLVFSLFFSADSETYLAVSKGLSPGNVAIGTGLVNSLAASSWGASGNIVTLLKYLVQYQIMLNFIIAGLASSPIAPAFNAFSLSASKISYQIFVVVPCDAVVKISTAIVDVLVAIGSSLSAFFWAVGDAFALFLSPVCPSLARKKADEPKVITEKNGWITKNWREQFYFVLRNGHLKYYTKYSSDSEAGYAGFIKLKDFVLAPKSSLAPNSIVLTPIVLPNQIVTLTCYSPLHVEEWRASIEYNIRLAKAAGGSGSEDFLVDIEAGGRTS